MSAERTKNWRAKYPEKYLAQKNRYYAKTENAENAHRPWGQDEDAEVLRRAITDTELSGMIGRSVRAIQNRRSRLTEREDA